MGERSVQETCNFHKSGTERADPYRFVTLDPWEAYHFPGVWVQQGQGGLRPHRARGARRATRRGWLRAAPPQRGAAPRRGRPRARRLPHWISRFFRAGKCLIAIFSRRQVSYRDFVFSEIRVKTCLRRAQTCFFFAAETTAQPSPSGKPPIGASPKANVEKLPIEAEFKNEILIPAEDLQQRVTERRLDQFFRWLKTI